MVEESSWSRIPSCDWCKSSSRVFFLLWTTSLLLPLSLHFPRKVKGLHLLPVRSSLSYCWSQLPNQYPWCFQFQCSFEGFLTQCDAWETWRCSLVIVWSGHAMKWRCNTAPSSWDLMLKVDSGFRHHLWTRLSYPKGMPLWCAQLWTSIICTIVIGSSYLAKHLAKLLSCHNILPFAG